MKHLTSTLGSRWWHFLFIVLIRSSHWVKLIIYSSFVGVMGVSKGIRMVNHLKLSYIVLILAFVKREKCDRWCILAWQYCYCFITISFIFLHYTLSWQALGSHHYSLEVNMVTYSWINSLLSQAFNILHRYCAYFFFDKLFFGISVR